VSNDSIYTHRRNEDGSFDSICWLCIAAVVRSKPESELAEYEKAHGCDSTSMTEEENTALLHAALPQAQMMSSDSETGDPPQGEAGVNWAKLLRRAVQNPLHFAHERRCDTRTYRGTR
jgi:hypothetical protein